MARKHRRQSRMRPPILETLEPRLLLAADVRITEFLASNQAGLLDSDGDDSDWIELHNVGDASENLGGWALTDNPADMTKWQLPAVDIDPGEIIVVFASGKDRNDVAQLHTNFNLSANGEYLALVNDSGVAVSDFAPQYPQQLTNISYGLSADLQTTGFFLEPTPLQPNSVAPIQNPRERVVISEIMYHTASQNSSHEYIELFNSGDQPVDLISWRIDGATNHFFETSTMLGVGEYLVLAADVDSFGSKYPTVQNFVGGVEGRLSNSGETIFLFDPQGNAVQEVAYGDDGDWAIRERGPNDSGHTGWIWRADHDGNGSSLELLTPELPSSSGQNWVASAAVDGTPGVGHAQFGNDLAPLISDVVHSPAVPTSTDDVLISARLTDELSSGVTGTLHWRLDGQPSFAAVGMNDAGVDGDWLAGDGVFTATLPPQADVAIVEFYVASADQGANTRTWPAPVGGTNTQEANLLYQVDDSFDPMPFMAADVVPQYRIILTAAERQELADIGQDVNGAGDSNAEMNATVIAIDGVDTQVRYNTGVRNRGAASATASPQNYRVNLTREGTIDGHVSFNLNSQFGALQVAASRFYEQAGVLTPNAYLSQAVINNTSQAFAGQPSYDRYAFVEDVNSTFLDNHFAGDAEGDIYRLRPGDVPTNPLRFEGFQQNAYADDYEKEANQSTGGYSDLISMLDVLNNAPVGVLHEQLASWAEVDQWVQYFSASALLVNAEANLLTGFGDNTFLVQHDVRFSLMPHDLDSVLGQGEIAGTTDAPIFPPPVATTLNRFLKQDIIVRKYHKALQELIAGPFSQEQLDPFLDEVLGGHLDGSVIDSMKQFAADRRDYVLSILPQSLTVETILTVQDGFAYSTEPSVLLFGVSNVANTAFVKVQGATAVYSPVNGTWSQSANLLPGINRLHVQSFETTGILLEEVQIDVWYDDGDMQTLGGAFPASATLDAASGPYFIDSTIVVPAGMTLTIEPGTTLFFDTDAGLTVNGRLVAEGTNFQHIRWTRLPSSNSDWRGPEFIDSPNDSRITYIDLEYSDGQGDATVIEDSQVTLDNITWSGITETTLELSNPQVIVRNSHFPGMADAEVIHGGGLSGDQYFILDGNVFDWSISEDDVVDFTGGNRPGPIFQILNNIFLGGNDDGIDLDGTDAHVEGNFFTNFHRNGSRSTTSNAIATGDNSGNQTEVTVARNIFYDNDHHILLKEDTFLTAQNNLFLKSVHASIQMTEVGGTSVDGPGKGAFLDGNIFWDTPLVFRHLDQLADPNLLTLMRSIVPASALSLGTDLIAEDPGIADPENGDFSLLPGSPAFGTGPNGLDMGRAVAAGASISGIHITPSPSQIMTVDVDGPGITDYKFRLDGGPESAEFAVGIPLELQGLIPGTHRIDVVGKNSAGVWQADVDATNATWGVNPAHSRLVISEVFLDNVAAFDHEGTFPSVIELHNWSATDTNLEQFSLATSFDGSRFEFPVNSIIGAGQTVSIYANADESTSGHHLGFELVEGKRIYLFEGNDIADSIQLGIQIPDYSVGRNSNVSLWGLHLPTPGQSNVASRLGNPNTLSINEWMTDGLVRRGEGFIEIHNPHASPVSLGGLRVTNRVPEIIGYQAIPSYSYIAPNGFTVLEIDPAANQPHEIDLSFEEDSGWIAIMDSGNSIIDSVLYTPQTRDISQGRVDEGTTELAHFDLPTPGMSNSFITVEQSDVSLIDITDVWSYDDSATDLQTAWREVGFDDSAWESGGGLLYFESSSLPEPKTTEINLGANTFYFRTHFNLDTDPANVLSLVTSTVIDDGAVMYLNGEEIFRLGVQADPVLYTSPGGRTRTNASREGPFTLPLDDLVQGDNVLAVEVHQAAPNSSDIVLGIELDVTYQEVIDTTPDYSAVLDNIRISEVDYNPVGGSGLEFVEVTNIGNSSVDLAGLRLADAVRFTFPSMMLDPGEYAVVVADTIAFESQYGVDIDVAGQYEGRLHNGGERLELLLPAPREIGILGFDYSDQWLPSTDGGGNSLNIADANRLPKTWAERTSWLEAAPSPGADFVLNFDAPVVLSVTPNAQQVDPADLVEKGVQPTSWSTQNSEILDITVKFNEVVQIAVDDIQLVNLGVDVPQDPDVPFALLANHFSQNANEVVLTFAAGELAEGVYRLSVAGTVVDLEGKPLDGDQDETGGDEFVIEGSSANGLFKLVSEFNGDAGVSVFDFSTFGYWFGSAVGVAPEYVDLNRDGGVSVFDFAFFSGNFGIGVNFGQGFAAINGDPQSPSSFAESVDLVIEEVAQRQRIEWNVEPRRRDRVGELELLVAAELEEAIVELVGGIE
jgi:hypothetical protein